jgi:hypothetical protein
MTRYFYWDFYFDLDLIVLSTFDTIYFGFISCTVNDRTLLFYTCVSLDKTFLLVSYFLPSDLILEIEHTLKKIERLLCHVW